MSDWTAPWRIIHKLSSQPRPLRSNRSFNSRIVDLCRVNWCLNRTSKRGLRNKSPQRPWHKSVKRKATRLNFSSLSASWRKMISPSQISIPSEPLWIVSSSVLDSNLTQLIISQVTVILCQWPRKHLQPQNQSMDLMLQQLVLIRYSKSSNNKRPTCKKLLIA